MNKKFDTLKITFAILVSIYFFYYASTSTEWHFIDSINLIFHEAGHTLTFFFGQFISIASGSLFQILIPVVCCLYFYKEQQYYSTSLLLFWVGQNLINVSVYVGDSINMQLPLLGGESAIHDWNYLLSEMGILKYAPGVADMIYLSGVLVMVMGLYYSITFSKNYKK